MNEDIGPARVWVNGSSPMVPGLAMSRSIGDGIAAKVGVIATPEIFEHRLTPNDKFLIIASDGIWEFISNETAVNIVSTYWSQGNIDSACEHLVRDSVRFWKQEDEVIDDITIIIVYLNVN
jgi:serine/threonine protein phosphatase PrpC